MYRAPGPTSLPRERARAFQTCRRDPALPPSRRGWRVRGSLGGRTSGTRYGRLAGTAWGRGRGVGREWASLLRRERESTGLSPARATRPNPWVPCATSSRAPGEGADGATGATGRRAPVPGREAAGG